MVPFIESNVSSLTVGAVSPPLFDKLDLPREKIVYYCDATCAPVCMTVRFNGWDALVLGLLVLAFALGQVSQALEMRAYVVGLLEGGGPTWWGPVLVYTVTGFAAFTLGSPWTAFVILIPVAMPSAQGLELPASLMLGAVLSGGVFSDHTRPFSDTSIISSMAAACDHVDHINSQMRDALAQVALPAIAFVVAGLTVG